MGVNAQMVSAWYNQQRLPIFGAIVVRLQLDTSDAARQRVSNLLMDFLRRNRHNEDLLRSFLRYTTGSANVNGEEIRVEVSSDTAAITHATCFSTITLPLIENNREAEAVFLLQLQAELDNTAGWSFNSG